MGRSVTISAPGTGAGGNAVLSCTRYGSPGPGGGNVKSRCLRRDSHRGRLRDALPRLGRERPAQPDAPANQVGRRGERFDDHGSARPDPDVQRAEHRDLELADLDAPLGRHVQRDGVAQERRQLGERWQPGPRQLRLDVRRRPVVAAEPGDGRGQHAGHRLDGGEHVALEDVLTEVDGRKCQQAGDRRLHLADHGVGDEPLVDEQFDAQVHRDAGCASRTRTSVPAIRLSSK